MSETTQQDSPLARWALRLAALWLTAGAVAKLFFGTPALLPAVIREHSPLSLDLTYTLVIGVEFALVALCFLRPRLLSPARRPVNLHPELDLDAGQVGSEVKPMKP